MHQVGDTGLLLRKFEPRDIPALYEFRNDPIATAGLGGFTTGYSIQDLTDWVEHHRSRVDEMLYAVIDTQSDRCIGHVGLYRVDLRSRKGEFAILIGSSEHQGKGYGEKITRFIIGYGFEAMNLRRITLTVLATNTRALALYEKLGFVREGTAREDEWRHGSYVDVIHMGLLRNEWLAAPA